MTKWEDKYFQTILMVRQKLNSINSQEMDDTYTLGRTDLHKLCNGKISADEIQYVCFDESACVLYALLIKVHDDNYNEYRKIIKHFR